MRQMIETLDRRLGMAAYGLPNGFLTNTVARLTLWRARRSHPGDAAGFRIPAEPYRELGQPYPEEHISGLQDAVTAAFESDAAVEKRINGTVTQRTVTSDQFSFHDHTDLRNVFPDTVKQAVEDHLGSYFSVARAEAFQNFAIPADKRDGGVSTFKWHTDFQPPSTVQLFITLTDVTPDDGPTEIAEAPPTAFTSGDRDYNTATSVSPDEITQMTGPAGTAYLFSPMRRLHRAGFVEPGHKRELILFELVPSSEALHEDWPERAPYADARNHRGTAMKQFRNL